jgi:hypothetical protein
MRAVRHVVESLDLAHDESITIGEALTRHYTTHGLPADGGESDPWFRVHIGPLVIPLPNPPARQRAVFFHDVNHVLTGYNTVFSDGEMAIAAFEVGAGCGRYVVAWYINLCLMALGVIIKPRLVFAAFVRGRNCSSTYERLEDRSVLRAKTVVELRRLVGVDAAVDPRPERWRASFAAWTFVAWLTMLVTAVLPFAVLWGMWAITRALAAVA